ncbi:unnamed protein product [Caenorhabditis angaria]|uniref:Uncharacterized protein n=1 Tax=Caenorhabditis angaria TaxID=860376 RepID=A0A9P1J0Q8_9PELO|nr:unnamed protein product [Caenorhabditis angaria]
MPAGPEKIDEKYMTYREEDGESEEGNVSETDLMLKQENFTESEDEDWRTVVKEYKAERDTCSETSEIVSIIDDLLLGDGEESEIGSEFDTDSDSDYNYQQVDDAVTVPSDLPGEDEYMMLRRFMTENGVYIHGALEGSLFYTHF